MDLEKKETDRLGEDRPAKRQRLWNWLWSFWQQEDVTVTATAPTLADLPMEMLIALMSHMPAHDAAIARGVCTRFKMAGDAVLNRGLSRLVTRAEAQLREVCTETHLAKVSGNVYRGYWLSHVSWTLAYVAQQARLLRAICLRYVRAQPQAGELWNHRISFYGGLVLDEAEQVLVRAAQCRRERQQPLQLREFVQEEMDQLQAGAELLQRLLHVGRLHRLMKRWVDHFHSQVEPQLLVASAVGLSPHPGCKPIDLLDCCPNVKRSLKVSWDDTGEWCKGRGRYVLLGTGLRVTGGRCQLLSAQGQQSLHACLSHLARQSARYSSSQPILLQELLACFLIDTGVWMETVTLQDSAPLMSMQRYSFFAVDGVWSLEDEGDEEQADGEEQGAVAEDEGEQHGQGGNVQGVALSIFGWFQHELIAQEESEDDMEREDEVVVKVRFTCRRHLAPLCVIPPPLHPLENSRKDMEPDSSELRQPDLQLRLVFHSPENPELGHCCCLIQQGGQLRSSTTGPSN